MARAATKPKATTLPVSERALLARINRALAKGQDEALSAGLLMVQRPGRYYVTNNDNVLAAQHCDMPDLEGSPIQ